MWRYPRPRTLARRQCAFSVRVQQQAKRIKRRSLKHMTSVYQNTFLRNDFYSRPVFCPDVISWSAFLKAKCLFLGTRHCGSKSATLPTDIPANCKHSCFKSYYGYLSESHSGSKSRQRNSAVDQRRSYPLLSSPFL